ncbi:related to Dynactin 6 [Ustilago trichophora]|uniref:Dynactin subunit 6 n=1 Tax=Ustilago trichophora TaxID=86804 RepID=A0A5C3E9G3_9BASI|nr:related to Dynactin 6 [Ustilago trichophora]
MSLLRALQRQAIISDLPSRPAVVESTTQPLPQTLTSPQPSTSSSNRSTTSENNTASSTLRPTLSTIFRRDNLTVGTRVIIAADADLRGEISVGSGTVIHPKATILALQGPISIGSNCIIEETAVIVNRKSTPIKIGDNNLFEVGCRIEAASVGSYNVFEMRSRVAQNVKVGSYSVIGAGCLVLPKPVSDSELVDIFDDHEDHTQGEQVSTKGHDVEEGAETAAEPTDTQSKGQGEVFEELPDQTVVFGADSRRRLWSGEGAQQQAALHAKHLEYLRDAIPRTHKLKIIQGVRAAPSTTPSIPPST